MRQIRAGEIQKAKDFINKVYKELMKDDPQTELVMNCQLFIEKIKSGSLMDALEFAEG